MANNGREDKRGVSRPPALSLFIGKEQEEVSMAAQQTVTRADTTDRCRQQQEEAAVQAALHEGDHPGREVKWEKWRRQIQRQRSSTSMHERCMNMYDTANGVTDEDLSELKGSMELGFGFNEENGGQNLCDTLPALDLYFAVNRQLSEPMMRVSTSSLPSLSSATSPSSTLCGTPSPRSPNAQPSLLDSLKICSRGDNPQLVKTRLRQWAQVVACSVKHSS